MRFFRKSIIFYRGSVFRAFILILFISFGLFLNTRYVFAHEFWIEPERWILEQDETLTAQIKVGQHFRGDASPFIRDWFSRFELHSFNLSVPVEGHDGDLPAFKAKLIQPGLNLLLYHSTPDTVYYSTMEKFEKFLKREGLLSILKQHKEQSYPEKSFSETYVRCAKSLIQVNGKSEFRDFFTGMPLEMVASFDPYDLKKPFGELQLLWNGSGIGGLLVRVFHKQGKMMETEYHTNDQGKVNIHLQAPGEYLVNAVHMMEGTFNRGEFWTSYWASLTFHVPQ